MVSKENTIEIGLQGFGSQWRIHYFNSNGIFNYSFDTDVSLDPVWNSVIHSVSTGDSCKSPAAVVVSAVGSERLSANFSSRGTAKNEAIIPKNKTIFSNRTW